MALILRMQVAISTRTQSLFIRFSVLITLIITMKIKTTFRNSMKLSNALRGSSAWGIEEVLPTVNKKIRLTSRGRAVIVFSKTQLSNHKTMSVATATQKAVCESQNKEGENS